MNKKILGVWIIWKVCILKYRGGDVISRGDGRNKVIEVRYFRECLENVMGFRVVGWKYLSKGKYRKKGRERGKFFNVNFLYVICDVKFLFRLVKLIFYF